MRALVTGPSVFWGVRSAWRMRRLVVVIWLVGAALAAPVVLIVGGAVGPPLSSVPPDTVLAQGEPAMLIVDGLVPVLSPLAIAIAVMLLLSWAFAVLWHAGVARFEVWGEGTPAPSRVLGLGLAAWWAYCRLALAALLVLLAVMTGLWAAVAVGVRDAYTGMAEGRMVVLIGLGVVAAAVVKLLVWAATLRGAWELAVPTRRSAVAAWLRGLAGVFVQPLATVRALLVLGTAAVGSALVPLVAPFAWPVLRGSALGVAVAVAAGLGAAFASVALFTAFAPVSGLVVSPADHGAETAATGGPDGGKS